MAKQTTQKLPLAYKIENIVFVVLILLVIGAVASSVYKFSYQPSHSAVKAHIDQGKVYKNDKAVPKGL